LFGPVTPVFADQQLGRQRRAGDCLAFNEDATTDLAMASADTWEHLRQRLPGGWEPNFIVLWLAHTSIPQFVWSAPVPVIGLAVDWHLQWHYYRQRLRSCDLVLTDTAGVEALKREGILQARAGNLFGCLQDWLDRPVAEAARDIDVLFVGNVHEAIQRERLPWLARLAALGSSWNVRVLTGIFGEDYRALLDRARIVFNYNSRGQCNRRAFEAAAAGALLFQQADYREVQRYFHDRQECVYYTSDNLESLLTYYLEHELERQSIAEAARNAVRAFTFENLWEECLGTIEREWPAISTRASSRHTPCAVHHGAQGSQGSARQSGTDLVTRTWQALGSRLGSDPTLAEELSQAAAQEPQLAINSNCLGLVDALQVNPQPDSLDRIAGCFRQASERDSANVVAGLNLAEALVRCQQIPQAVAQAREVLRELDRQPQLTSDVLNAGHFPVDFDHFRVEWERAAWAHASQADAEAEAKRQLIQWRLHTLLAQLTGELPHYQEAARLRPDLALSQAALGCALGRNGQPVKAVPHLRQAVDAGPFDLDAARALFLALGETGARDEQHKLAHARQLLARASPQLVPPETWFMQVPPAGNELASIIILCCNQLDYTRQCLESVLRYTRPPYELILVDNGSDDGTGDYLQEICAQPGPARVVVIRNNANRGFAAGCNQAIVASRGRYLLLLNNDTVVTDGWLKGLVAWSLHDWPKVGLVGPMSNYAPPPQHLAQDYQDMNGMETLARRRRQEFGRQAMRVERLTGFCLLVRREVLERVGGFDEGFGPGFFEDDDLCVRAREAGFQLLLAQDVLIHHYGSRTFHALGIDAEAQLRQNFERFRVKWGPARTAAYCRSEQLTPTTTVERVPHSPNGRMRISLCLIVKNEEHNLPACLHSAANLVDEVIVVDTGSTDRTKDVAAGFGARVFDFPWVDSFSAARNESLRHATGEWIFWLDADDRVDESNRRKLKELFANLPDQNLAYAMKCVCLADSKSSSGTVVDHVRLFRNYPEIRWRYRVHEQILPAIRARGGQVHAADIAIHHAGYQDVDLRRRKQLRDLRLLHLDQADDPDEPFTLFNLGWAYSELGRPDEALPLLRRSLQRSHPGDSIVRKLFALIMECHRRQGRVREALAACQEGRKFYPDDTQLLFQEALLREEHGDLPGAESCLQMLLTSSETAHFASVAEGLRGFRARGQLAGLYHKQGRPAEAEVQWRAALAERPDYSAAWLGLVEIYVGQGRFADLEELARRLDTEQGTKGQIYAAFMRCRGHLARQDFARARQVTEAALTHFPREIMLLRALSYALLQEDRDRPAAERVLRRILELDPDNQEVQNNLRVLLHRAL
jgi:GT2 family glycosyltransferase/Tfp pilus assembly protein PilF